MYRARGRRTTKWLEPNARDELGQTEHLQRWPH